MYKSKTCFHNLGKKNMSWLLLNQLNSFRSYSGNYIIAGNKTILEIKFIFIIVYIKP